MKIPVLPGLAVMVGAFGVLAACAMAQVPPTATLPAAPAIGPMPPVVIAPDLREVLQMLRDRKDTLKDFVSKIDYNVEDKSGDVSGKKGTVAFLMDPVKAAMFSVEFNVSTATGLAPKSYHQQIIFDGRELTTKDYGVDGKSKLYTRSNMLPPGAKPGDAVTLNGALPLPIGIEVDEVVHNFEATLLPAAAGGAKDPDHAVLKLVPRVVGKFDYDSLVVTVDKKLQLPTKLELTAPGGGSTTTMVLTEIKVNTSAAKMLDATTPAADGWTERK